MRNGYTKHLLKCEGTECEIFESLATDMEVSNNRVPPIKSKTDPILPFYYTSANDAKLKLNVKDLGENEDACFHLQYMISQKSQLGVSYTDLEPLQFSPTIDTLNVSQWFPKDTEREELCVSDLTKSHDKDFELFFTSEITDQDNEIIAMRLIKQNNAFISVRPIEQGVMKELPFLTHWSRSDNISFDFVNQWPLRYPNALWHYDNNTDLIEFLCKY